LVLDVSRRLVDRDGPGPFDDAGPDSLGLAQGVETHLIGRRFLLSGEMTLLVTPLETGCAKHFEDDATRVEGMREDEAKDLRKSVSIFLAR
jgi:hypothetical protein